MYRYVRAVSQFTLLCWFVGKQHALESSNVSRCQLEKPQHERRSHEVALVQFTLSTAYQIWFLIVALII